MKTIKFRKCQALGRMKQEQLQLWRQLTNKIQGDGGPN